MSFEWQASNKVGDAIYLLRGTKETLEDAAHDLERALVLVPGVQNLALAMSEVGSHTAAVAAVQQVVPATPVVAAPAPWDAQPVPPPAQQQYAANVPQVSGNCAHGPRRKMGPYNNNGRMQYTLYCALNRDDPREKCKSTKIDA